MIKKHVTAMTEFRLPRIGTIVKGGAMTRGATPQQNRPGKDLDYFRLTNAEPDVAQAFAAVYGPTPRQINGLLPYERATDNLVIWDELYVGSRLLWRGDGDRLHIEKVGDKYVQHKPDKGPLQPKQPGEKIDGGKVMRRSRLQLLLPELGKAGLIEVVSSSVIDADELWANILWLDRTLKSLHLAPVTVFRSPRQFEIKKGDGDTMSVTKYMLHLMMNGAYAAKLLPQSDVAVTPQLMSGPSDAALLVDDDEDAADGLWEDEGGMVYQDGVIAEGNAIEPFREFVKREGRRPQNVEELRGWFAGNRD